MSGGVFVEDLAEARADLPARIRAARALVERGAFAEALDEVTWLWSSLRDHPTIPHETVLDALEPLLARDPTARARFAAIRATLAPGPTFDRARFLAWHLLNRAFGEIAATLAWFDALADGPTRRAVEGPLYQDLIATGAWAAAGRIRTLDVAIALVRRQRQHVQRCEARAANELAEATARFRADAGDLVRALAAAGRTLDVATALAAIGDADPCPELAARLAEARSCGGADAGR